MSRSKRNRNHVSYFEPEEPSFDDYIFCSECGDYVYEYCSIHGPLLVIPDDEIFDKNRKPLHSVDARDPNKSNWMRYVNCSRHFSEQNLLAFQYKGQLYYRTIKIIPRFTELLVFYGSEFANELNIDLRRYHSSTFEKPLVKREPEDDEHGTQTPEIKIVKCFSIVKPEPELEPEDVRDTQIPEMKLVKCFSTVKREPVDNETVTQTPEIKIVKCISIVKPELGLEDVQDTQIPEKKLVKCFTTVKSEPDDDEHVTQTPEIKIVKCISIVKPELGLEDVRDTQIPEIKLVKCFTTVKSEPDDDEHVTQPPEIKIVKCISIVKPELGPEDVRDTQIPEIKLVKCFTTVKIEPDDEETQKPEMKLVKYEMDDVEQNMPIPMQPVRGFTLKNELDDEQAPTTSQEMQLDTDTVVNAKKNIHYEIEIFTEDKNMKENINSDDFETEYNTNCGESFDQNKPNGLKMQNIATGFDKIKKYTCPICETAFVTKSEFINHDIKTHGSKKNYKACTICDYKTVKTNRLKQHIETHRNEKYKCDICEYETQYVLYLQRHKRTHVCKYCQQIFKTGDQLYKHVKRHKDGKTYDCSKCDHTSVDRSEYITHFKTHTKSTHACTICFKVFGKAYHLKRHEVTHSQLRPYVCEICKCGFKHTYNFRRHMNKIHTNTYNNNK